MKLKTFFITDKNGKALVTIETNNPRISFDESMVQVTDISEYSRELKKAMLANPDDFDKHGNKKERDKEKDK